MSLQKAIAKRLGLSQRMIQPRVLSVKSGSSGSNQYRRTKDVRSRWLYNEIARDRVQIDPRCSLLVEALQQWDYGDKHPLKDILDGFMYGLRDYWREGSGYHGGTVRFQ